MGHTADTTRETTHDRLGLQGNYCGRPWEMQAGRMLYYEMKHSNTLRGILTHGATLRARRGAESGDGGGAGVHPSVVVVDDDEAIRETLRLVLEDAGYAVKDVADGPGALALLRSEERPAVVLLDLIMPRMDGDVLLREATGDETLARHCWVLMTAAHKRLTPDLRRLLETVEAPVLPKPFDLDALLALVAEQAQRAEQ